MGIQGGAKIFKHIFKNKIQSIYQNIVKLDDFVLVFDGPLLFYCGLGVLNEEAQAKKIIDIIHGFSRMYRNKPKAIFLYFDGKVPTLKNATQKKRQQTPFNFQRVLQLTEQHIQNLDINSHIIKMQHGEAENEMFHDFNNICNYANASSVVYYTKDTDFLTLAWGNCHQYINGRNAYFYYPAKEIISDIQELTVMQKHNFLLDLSNVHFHCWLDAPKFRYLMILLGTDYVNSVFTSSMVRTIISHNPTDDEIQQMKQIHDDNVLDIIDFFLIILLRSTTLFKFPLKLTLLGSCDANHWLYFLDNILWNYRYFTKGIAEIMSDSDREYTQINAYRFLVSRYADLLTLPTLDTLNMKILREQMVELQTK